MFYVILTVLLFLCDQATKFATTTALNEFESVNVIGGILSFTRYHNTGGPWSIFDGAPIFFIIITIIIFIAEFIYLKKHPLKDTMSKISVSLINAGAIGNFVDRIFRGYVVDMIEVKFIDYPVFNFADCLIVIGCILLCVYVIFIYKEDKKEDIKDGKDNACL